MKNELNAFKKYASEEISNFKLKIKTILTFEDGDERLEKIVDFYTQINSYIYFRKICFSNYKKNLEPFIIN